MEPVTVVESRVIPLDRANVDTDAIIPKQFLKTIERKGLGKHLFHDWRYLADGTPDPTFILNEPALANARILLARENFGCGSSREHAPWALADYGIRVIIAPSFADIFANNCAQNGILLITLAPQEVEELFVACRSGPLQVRVDLPAQRVHAPLQVYSFAIAPGTKEKLLLGLDDIQSTLSHRDTILAYEATRKREAPWLFQELRHG
ncbi:MAG: 3-isopropylmalate dehydratase small subunit [Acidithiobacillus sp.]|nr:3-isopropylmalate dehydratase small subunit [Acidithiobacillus sp.]